MVSESPSDSALLALQRATHATLYALSRELAGLGLTAAEINALANLAEGRPRTVSELSGATGTRPTTLTSVLDRLERHGHVTRGPRPGEQTARLLDDARHRGVGGIASMSQSVGDEICGRAVVRDAPGVAAHILPRHGDRDGAPSVA